MSEINQNHSMGRREPQPGGGREEPRARAKRRKKRRPLILTIIILFFQLVGTLLLVGAVTGSFLICYAAVYVKTAVIPTAHLDLSDVSMNENSVIYYADKTTGQWRELQTLVGNENRELVEYKDFPEDLIHAIVAIEDKRFWQHQGVDWIGTARGLSRLFTGGNIQGGSTITQQMIKNATNKKDVTVTRKIWEIFTALDLEKNYTKEDILTIYLNYIYLGNGCHGVQAASQYYFGKDVSDLTLAECASLAGITNNPSLYAPKGLVEVLRYRCTNPDCDFPYSLTKDEVCGSCGAENSYDNGSVWTNKEFNKSRQELILGEMANPEISPNGAYITEAERDAAKAQPLTFAWEAQTGEEGGADQDKAAKPSPLYSWYVEAVIDEAIRVLMDETKLSEKWCTNRVFSGGLKIYVPYDPDIQAAVDAIYNDRANLDQVSSRTGQRLASAITVVDNSTGYVVALGNTMEKTLNRGFNASVDALRQPGSSIKPLSVYSPALEMKLITPATVIDDSPQELNGRPWPINVTPTYRGLTTVLYGITQSLNTVAVRVLDQVTPQESFNFMTERYGFTSLEAYRVNRRGEVQSDIDRSPLAMGGLTRGVSTYEMAAAFATFPRNGVFSKATTVLEIRDAEGKVLVDNRPESKPVIQSDTAYYINSMLTNAVNTGTGYNARISGQTVAGKTGTTNDWYDLWFCGYTSYYTAAVWTGYPDFNEVVNRTGYNPSVVLWQKVMSIVHENLENRAFEVPRSLSSYSVCIDCGKLSTADCENDVRGNRVQSFRLLEGDGPKEYCQCHVPVQVCTDSIIFNAKGEPSGRYHLAGEFCPEESVRTLFVVDFQREQVGSTYVGDSDALLSFYDTLGEEGKYCHVHTSEPIPSDDPLASDDPWSSDNPDASGSPDIPPDSSPDPWTDPTPEPTGDPLFPFYEPTPEPTEPAYVPAADEGPDWLGGWR